MSVASLFSYVGPANGGFSLVSPKLSSQRLGKYWETNMPVTCRTKQTQSTLAPKHEATVVWHATVVWCN